MNQKLRFLVQFASLAAIEAIFCFTPLGSLPAFGPIVATLAMIPVILTALLLGTGAGTAMGALAGLFSFLVWTFAPPSPITAFVFTPFYALGEFHGNVGSLLICFVPRILVGTVAGLLYKLFSKTMPTKSYLGMVIASFAASMVNTIGVMAGIWLFFGSQYASIAGQSILIIIGTTVLTSGIPEAVVSAVVCPAACKAVNAALKRGYSRG